MRVPIKKELHILELQKEINQAFTNYTTSIRQNRILVVKKSGSAAALIVPGRPGIARVNEGFPSMGQQMLFVLFMLALGILPPLIIYLIVWHPAQKAIRNEMADFIKSNYGG